MKKQKEEVQYGKGHLHSHCGRLFHDDRWSCKHFRAGVGHTGNCEIVVGTIMPEYWCDQYQRAWKSS